jgi:hypothetical protein
VRGIAERCARLGRQDAGGGINILNLKEIGHKQILGVADATSCNEHRAGSAPNLSVNHNVG